MIWLDLLTLGLTAMNAIMLLWYVSEWQRWKHAHSGAPVESLRSETFPDPGTSWVVGDQESQAVEAQLQAESVNRTAEPRSRTISRKPTRRSAPNS